LRAIDCGYDVIGLGRKDIPSPESMDAGFSIVDWRALDLRDRDEEFCT
jgi:hypothetical protein